MRGLSLGAWLFIATVGVAAPAGFVKTTIPLNAPPVGLAFGPDGTLYALEGAAFGDNEATVHVIQPGGTISASYSVHGEEPDSFYIGGMGYDPINERLLISDNAGVGRLYSVDLAGHQHIVAEGIANIAGVAVRDTGEVFVSTATGGFTGEVLRIVSGAAQPVLGGLDYGAGLAFDTSGKLIVQDVSFVLPTFESRGRLQRVRLEAGTAEPLMDQMHSGYSVVVDGVGNIFATGTGGLYQVSESPLAERLIAPAQFSAAAALLPGTKPFQAFGGADGGKLAYAAEAVYGSEDLFVTILTPAEPGDYNADGQVNGSDYSVWRAAFGTNNAAADGNRDGLVDAADYILWRAHVVTPSLGSAGSSVPEPTLFALATAPLLALSARRRRR